MNDNTIKIEVDGKELEVRPGQMLIEVTDANDIYIPRFCYHKKLSVAANCRMCLVEVEKAPKPLPACATPVMDGMKVKTNSNYAREAQKSVMEFLLINHPLDCPICDQGGECELQDLAIGYGRDVSRYQETKRVVKDKDIGPLVQTEMTRCIHCTRCVRFGEEVAGLRELGSIGRGEQMEIGTYIEKAMVSEMSGNVIDLCPVGALTSKPFRFSARTWEMRQFEGVAPHDAVGSNLHFHVKDQRVKRVVPAENEAINEIWISDRDRFSYEGLYSDDRLLVPMIKQDNEWKEVDWETAFATVKERLTNISPDRIGALSSATASTEELYLLQGLMRGLGSANIDHRLRQIDFSDQDKAPLYLWLGVPIASLETLNAALVIGGNPRKEQPIINHRLRKAALSGAGIMMVNSVDYDLNYDLAAKAIVSPSEIVTSLAGIAKALLEQDRSGADANIEIIVDSVVIDGSHRAIASTLMAADSVAVFLGNHATAHTQFSTLRYLAGMIAKLSNADFGYLGGAANTAGAWLAGAVPHRLPAGKSVAKPGLDAHAMLQEKLDAYVLLNIEPELDCWDGHLAAEAMAAADCVVALTPYKTSAMESYADILLPIALYAENEGSYFNVEGTRQAFSAVVKPQGESRPAWKVLRVLADNLGVKGMGYNNFNEISDELIELLDELSATNLDAWRVPDSVNGAIGGLQRVSDFPTNSIDSLVRRADALQKTIDIADGIVHINQNEARNLGLNTNGKVRAKQNGYEVELSVLIDDRLPNKTVLIQASHASGQLAGPLSGEITLENV